MIVGIDLRIFQIGHQYRGIGAHISNLLREFSKLPETDKPTLVFYEYPNLKSGLNVVKDCLDALDYEVRKTKPQPTEGSSFLKREYVAFKERVFDGDAGLNNLSGIDVLLCSDFNLGVPRPRKAKTVLISYDMIPWVLSDHYLPDLVRIFKKTHGPRRAIKAQLEKWLYFHKIKQANKRAAKVLSISEHTKKDLVKYLHIKPRKIKTVLLGIDPHPVLQKQNTIKCIDHAGKKRTIDVSKEQFVFFMGGADRRRRIEDLVEAFDIACDENPDLLLILAGYDFQSIAQIPDHTTKEAIEHSRHHKRIYFAGFITDRQRGSLFSHAIAYVFPSVYEGFGLPILEAMILQCPAITYNNSSIQEIGGKAALYADGPTDIAHHITKIINSKSYRQKLVKLGDAQAKKFSWKKTATQTLKELRATAHKTK